MGDVINLAQRIAERERRKFERSTPPSVGADQVFGSSALVSGSCALSSGSAALAVELTELASSGTAVALDGSNRTDRAQGAGPVRALYGWQRDSSAKTTRVSQGARRAQSRSRVRVPQSAAFFFDLGCPLSYLAAERVERNLGEVSWVPTGRLDRSRDHARTLDPELVALAEREAAALRLPLIMPEHYPSEGRGALRAAAFAAGRGAGARFAIAAFRLAFCGGFDLDDPEVIQEAAAAAGVDVIETLEAVRDPRWDVQPSGTSRGLLGQGISSVPAIRVGHRWFEGIDAVGEASLFATFHVVQDAAEV